VKLSQTKAASMAYVFNNHKIRKIVSIQIKKETILATVEKLKVKLKNWRIFARDALDDNLNKKQVDQSEKLVSKLSLKSQDSLKK